VTKAKKWLIQKTILEGLIDQTVDHFFVEAGSVVELQPAADLWMRGARTGRVLRVVDGFVHVRPIVEGREIRKTFRVPLEHIQFPKVSRTEISATLKPLG